MFVSAQNRDIKTLLSIFSVHNQNLSYHEVYLHVFKINKQTKMLKDELEILTRYLWKYQFLTLSEFAQYY
jgi:hypothetical protein